MTKLTQIYPKTKKVKPLPKDRPFFVEYDLVFDNGNIRFIKYYRTEFGARWSAFWWFHFRSWGGSAVLVDLR